VTYLVTSLKLAKFSITERTADQNDLKLGTVLVPNTVLKVVLVQGSAAQHQQLKILATDAI